MIQLSGSLGCVSHLPVKAFFALRTSEHDDLQRLSPYSFAYSTIVIARGPGSARFLLELSLI